MSFEHRITRTLLEALLNFFLMAKSRRAHSARRHGPTSVNSVSLSRLLAAAAATKAPALLRERISSAASSSSFESQESTLSKTAVPA